MGSASALLAGAVEVLAAEPPRVAEVGPEGIAAGLGVHAAGAVLIAAGAHRDLRGHLDGVPFAVAVAALRAAADRPDGALVLGATASAVRAPVAAPSSVIATCHKVITPFVKVFMYRMEAQ